MLPLYDPIPIDYTTDEFKTFLEGWKVENSDERLNASVEERMRGAFLEFAYIARGADNDPTKYRDVIASEEIAGEHSGIVDCKTTHVRTTRTRLFPLILNTLHGKRSWFKEKGIQKVHYWAENKRTNELEFWFVYDVETDTHSRW